jgi:hypothetical protein
MIIKACSHQKFSICIFIFCYFSNWFRAVLIFICRKVCCAPQFENHCPKPWVKKHRIRHIQNNLISKGSINTCYITGAVVSEKCCPAGPAVRVGKGMQGTRWPSPDIWRKATAIRHTKGGARFHPTTGQHGWHSNRSRACWTCVHQSVDRSHITVNISCCTQ